MKSSKFSYAFAKNYVGSSSGHVGRNSNRPSLACHGNNLGLLFMVFCIEHSMFDTFIFQLFTEIFRNIDGDCTHQNRLPFFIQLYYLIHRRFELFFPGLVYNIRKIGPYHELICGHNNHIKIINLFKFRCFSICRACHPCKFIIHPEVILKCDCGKCLILVFYLYVFLCFQRLVQSFTVTTSRHQTACKFIYDNHLSILDNIVDISLEKGMGF